MANKLQFIKIIRQIQEICLSENETTQEYMGYSLFDIDNSSTILKTEEGMAQVKIPYIIPDKEDDKDNGIPADENYLGNTISDSTEVEFIETLIPNYQDQGYLIFGVNNFATHELVFTILYFYPGAAHIMYN